MILCERYNYSIKNSKQLRKMFTVSFDIRFHNIKISQGLNSCTTWVVYFIKKKNAISKKFILVATWQTDHCVVVFPHAGRIVRFIAKMCNIAVTMTRKSYYTLLYIIYCICYTVYNISRIYYNVYFKNISNSVLWLPHIHICDFMGMFILLFFSLGCNSTAAFLSWNIEQVQKLTKTKKKKRNKNLISQEKPQFKRSIILPYLQTLGGNPRNPSWFFAHVTNKDGYSPVTCLAYPFT